MNCALDFSISYDVQGAGAVYYRKSDFRLDCMARPKHTPSTQLSGRSVRRISATESPTDISGQLSNRKDLLYQFKMARSGTVYLGLGEFSSDVDLSLLNSKQRVVKKSAQAGLASESISSPLKKGTYLIRVQPKTSDKTSFRLKLGTTDPSLNLSNGRLTASRSAATPITSTTLRATDKLQFSDQLRYRITTSPRNGQLLFNGVALGAGDSFTQVDIDKGRLTYRGTGGLKVLGSASNLLANGPLVSGVNLLWVGTGGSDGGSDTEVFFYDGSSTRQLTQNNVNERAEGIDGNHLVWASQIGAVNQGVATYELFDSDGSTIRQLTNNAVTDSFVGVSGDNLFWSSPVGGLDSSGRVTSELFYAKAGAVRQLTSNAVNEDLSDFDGTSAVWSANVGQAAANGRATSEVFYFDGNSVRQLTTNAVNDSSPRISGSRIAWSSQIGALNLGAATDEIMLYNGSSIQQITNNDIDDFMGDISGNTIAWIGRSGEVNSLGLRSYEIYRYDGSSSQRLTNNSYDDSVVDLDGSNLLWRGMAGPADSFGQRSYELFFNNGSTTTQLTSNQVDDRPTGLKGSTAVWFSQMGSPNAIGTATREIFYFDGSRIQQLTSDAKEDDLPSFSDQLLAWRSTEGTTSQILSYELGDEFSYTVSDGNNPASAIQTFKIQYQ